MQPKGKGIAVMIGIGKPSGGPPPLRGPGEKEDASERGQIPARGRMPMTHSPEGEPDQDEQAGVPIGPEDVDYSDNDLCETCANMGEDGNCRKYRFSVQPTGHCEAGYEPKDESGEEYGSGEESGQGGEQEQGGY